jgi:hypothetical protein
LKAIYATYLPEYEQAIRNGEMVEEAVGKNEERAAQAPPPEKQ